jgi:uncharacterized protein YqeY
MAMSIKEQLTGDMKQAMRDKDKASLVTIRMLIDVIQKKEKDLLRDATEDEVIQVLQTFKKQNEESLEAFAQRGDTERVQEKDHVRTIIDNYLPTQLKRDEIYTLVDLEVQKLQFVSLPINKGSLMKAVMPWVKGKADNKIISEVVDEALRR